MCSCKRHPKHRPYGQKRALYWCYKCDANLVAPINKSNTRQKAKLEIQRALNE